MASSVDAFAEATAAGIGGIFSSTILFPMETIKNLMAASSKGKKGDAPKDSVSPSMTNTALTVYKQYGLQGFYRGAEFSALGSCTEKFIYFYAYNFLQKISLQVAGTPSGELNVPTALAIGALAEWFHLPVTLPLETLLVQVMKEKNSRNPFQIFRDTVKKNGIWVYFKALPAFVVLCLKPAIQYTIYNRLKLVLLQRKRGAARTLSSAQAFCLGAIARCIATVITFPYNRAKFIKQGNPSEKSGLSEILVKLFNSDGIYGLYTGLYADLIRGVLSSALMLMCKEKIQELIKAFLLPNKTVAHHIGTISATQ